MKESTMKSLLLFALLSILRAINGMVLVCDFKYQDNFDYTCDVKYLRITQKNDRTITEVFGDHLRMKGSNDVTHFSSKSNVIKFLPLNLATFFKNLEAIKIENATMREIEGSDLRQFGGTLKEIWLSENYIEALENGLFDFNPNISKLKFEKNKIKHVDDGVLSNLENLEELYFLENVCYYRSAEYKQEIPMVVNEIESKCKDATYMVKRYELQLEEMRVKMSSIEAECKCCKCAISTNDNLRSDDNINYDEATSNNFETTTIKAVKSKIFINTNGSPV